MQVPVKDGGTVLGGQGEPPDSSAGAYEDIKPRYRDIHVPRVSLSLAKDHTTHPRCGGERGGRYPAEEDPNMCSMVERKSRKQSGEF